jgi:RNA recognition motif-containing protein
MNKKHIEGQFYDQGNFEIYLEIEFDKELLDDDPSLSKSVVFSSSRSNNMDNDSKTIIVRNINSDSNIDELEHLFNKFGIVNKVTFVCDKYNGNFKGYKVV